MTQKRILRAKARTVVRERELKLRDACRLYWADADDPKIVGLVGELTQDDPDETAVELFGMVNRLIHEATDLTGETPDAVLVRLQRDEAAGRRSRT